MNRPEEIIEESRELEGVAVDLGEDKGDSEFLFGRLCSYAKIINNDTLEGLELAKIINKYNTVLYIYLSTLTYQQIKLNDQASIPEKYTLLRYLEHVDYLNRKGKFTFERSFYLFDYIGHIKIISKSLFKDGKMKIREIENFKGKTKKTVLVYTGWGNEYDKGKEYLVFWNSGEIVSYSSKGRLEIFFKGNDRFVSSGWHPSLLPFSANETGEFESEFSLNDFKSWHKNIRKKIF